ncbi:MAG: PDZ domain-containing protein [bacterium]
MRTSMKVLLVVALVAVMLVGTVAAKKYRSRDDVWLGISFVSVDSKLVDKHELAKDFGVYVKGVIDDSPADEIGLERGDLIVALDGQKIVDANDLTDILEDHQDGDKVTLEYYRGSDHLSVAVELRDRPQKTVYSFSSTPNAYRKVTRTSGRDHGFIGVKLAGLSRQLGEYFGVERGRGALISEVEKDGPAAKAGLMAGDVIIGIDGAKVTDVSDVADDIADIEPGEKADIKVIRDKKERVVTVEVGEGYGDSYGNMWFDGDNEFVWGDHDNDFTWLDGHALQGLQGIEALEGLEDLQRIEIPDVPGLPGAYFFSKDGRYRRHEIDGDKDELDEEMDKLRDELKNLKKELQDLRLKLD